MGFFSMLSDWKAASYERKITKMKAQGICPECRGKGVHSLLMNEFAYLPTYDCAGCNGSGLFSDWVETNPQHS